MVDIGGIQDDRGATVPIQIGSDLAGPGAKILLLTAADTIFNLVEYFCWPFSFLLRLLFHFLFLILSLNRREQFNHAHLVCLPRRRAGRLKSCRLSTNRPNISN